MMFGKITRNLVSVVFVIAIVNFSGGCYKLKQTFMMKGEWTVQSVEIDGGTTNHMNTILPEYDKGNNCCKYVLYFGEDGKLAVNYFVDNTLNYAIAGEWRLIEHNLIYLDVDKFVKGFFEVEQESNTDVIMLSDNNFIEFFNIGYVQMLIRAHRD